MDIDITDRELLRIMQGNEHIQNIVPHLSPEDREFLITGITPEEWKELFDTVEE